MKTTQSSGTRPDHQTVAGTLEFKSNGKAIAIGFTDQQLSPHAGSATFWGWLRLREWCKCLAAALPHPLPTSNNKLLPVEKALAFMHGLLCDARKLTHVAYLRRDPLAPELLGIKRIASQSVLTRFFQGFTSAGDNLRCFRPLWHWCLDRLPSAREGYTLDLDSTRLLHKDGQQEGVVGGYTKQGIKPCLHPLLAVLAEVRLVAQLWLRPGNATCGNNVTAFFLDLWSNLPRHLRLRGVRADSGFCLPELLVVADGATWIWNLTGDRFPQAHQRLDYYHASEHLWAVAHALHADDDPAARQWVEPLLRQLQRGRVPALLNDLRTLAKRLRKKKRQAVAAELAYLESHQDRMDYAAARRNGEPEGSGAMESTCRQYQCRFKRPGQFWSRVGDEALMCLDTFWRNDRWHLLFPHIQHQDPRKN